MIYRDSDLETDNGADSGGARARAVKIEGAIASAGPVAASGYGFKTPNSKIPGSASVFQVGRRRDSKRRRRH
jgi:hypothetical protein